MRAVVSSVLSVGVALSIATSVAAATVPLPPGVEVEGDVGDVVLVTSLDERQTIDRGNGFDVFTLALPDGATCPGDSANDQWRVQTFMVPVVDDPLELVYGAVGPEPWDGGERFALYGTDTVPFVDELLERNNAAGSPGRILPFPPFSFSIVSVQRLAPIEYRVGVACTFFGATTRYWDTLITVTKAGDDPDEFEWRLSGAPEAAPDTSSGSSNTLAMVVGGAVLIVLLGGAWALRSRIRVQRTQEIRS